MKRWKQSGMPDEELTGALSAYAPGDTDTMERIFKRSEAKYQQMQEPFAEEETYQVEHDPPRVLLRVMAGLAACAVVGIGGWGLWKLSQHEPPVSPISPEQCVESETAQVPFLEALDEAIANGYDLQFYGNPDEEGYPVLSVTQIEQFRTLMDTVNWTETEGQNAENDCIKLVIPADNAENYQSVYFYPEWIYYSESPTSSFLHCYAAPEGLYDALRTTIFAENVTAVPETISITLTAKDVTPDGLTLVLDTTEPIPADTILYGKEFSLWALQDDEWVRVPQFNEDAVFTSEGYPFTQRTELAIDWNWIYGTLSQGHYRIGKRFTDSRRTGDSTDYELYAEFDITPEMCGTPVSELPFSVEEFRNDLMFMMTPAYAPKVFSVTGVQGDLADAMERSVWLEADPTLRDGESVTLFVRGGDGAPDSLEGAHYALEFDHLGYVYVHFGDGETIADCTPTKVYRVSSELTLAAQKLASKPAMKERNGMDPTEDMFDYEPRGGNAVNEVWEEIGELGIRNEE